MVNWLSMLDGAAIAMIMAMVCGIPVAVTIWAIFRSNKLFEEDDLE